MSELKKIPRSAVAEGQAASVELGGRRLAVYNVGGACYASEDACPHRGGPLGEGTLSGHVVACPWHDWKYDVRTGRCVSPADAQVKTYRVTARGDDLLVEI